MKNLLVRFWRDEKITSHGLLVVAIIVLALVGLRLAHGEEAETWYAVAIIKTPAKAFGIVYAHDPFPSQKECDDFRASNEEYKAANAKLEAKVKALGVEAEFDYACLPLSLPPRRKPGEESL
jgi:hypothetical protein